MEKTLKSRVEDIVTNYLPERTYITHPSQLDPLTYIEDKVIAERNRVDYSVQSSQITKEVNRLARKQPLTVTIPAQLAATGQLSMEEAFLPNSIASLTVPEPTAILEARKATPQTNTSRPPRPVITDPRFMPEVQRPIRNAKLKMARALDEVTDALIMLAKGVTVQTINSKTGETKVFDLPPDVKAINTIFDRVMGRSVEFKEVSSNATNTNISITLPDNGRDDQPNYSVIDIPPTSDEYNPFPSPAPTPSGVLFPETSQWVQQAVAPPIDRHYVENVGDNE